MLQRPSVQKLLAFEESVQDGFAKGLELVAQMAADAGGQVWMEKVSDDGRGCSVLIEDGAVAGAEDAELGGEAA